MSELTPLTGEALNTLRSEFDADGTSRLAMNAVTAAGIDKVARNYDRARLLQRRFSTTVDNGFNSLDFGTLHRVPPFSFLLPDRKSVV